MSDLTAEAPVAGPDAPVLQRLSRLDRFLPVWIIATMVLGIGLGRVIPGLADALNTVTVGSVSLPIAVGLLLMMYPVLAKVRYRQLDHVTGDKQLLVTSLVLNWVVGPALMFALAWLLLPDLPTYRTGLIIVGLARCIAMVLIWNDLSCGDREAGAVLVAINSVFQILAFGLLGWFYLQVLPGWLGLNQVNAGFSITTIVGSVLVFLGIPLLAGFLTRTLGEKRKGQDWYENRFLPKIGPVALYGLLFTIVVLFALQGHTITTHPWDVVRIAAPLLVYFAVMFGGSFALGHRLHFGTPRPRPWRSPRPATTSSSPSPWRSGSSVSPPVRPWPGSSARSSRCRCWSAWSTWRCGCAAACTGRPPPRHRWRPPRERHPGGAVRVRAQRRALADGRRFA